MFCICHQFRIAPDDAVIFFFVGDAGASLGIRLRLSSSTLPYSTLPYYYYYYYYYYHEKGSTNVPKSVNTWEHFMTPFSVC